MRQERNLKCPPRALTIAGSDSGGGAGIQADLKTFQELGVYGMSALTAITAQNTQGVQAVYPLEPEAVSQQLDSIGTDIGADALKTGMLFSEAIIGTVAGAIRRHGWKHVVVDPVMIAKGGAALLREDAITALRRDLFPVATVVTPNIPEAEALSGRAIRNGYEMREAARILANFGASNVIIKGGHSEGALAVDLLFDGGGFAEVAGPRIETRRTHGTGCTFSAALTAGLAQGRGMEQAVGLAKAFIQAAIEDEILIGNGHGPTNHWAYRLRSI